MTGTAFLSGLFIPIVKWIDVSGVKASGVLAPALLWIYERRMGIGLLLLGIQSGSAVALGLFKLKWFRPIDRLKIENVLQQEVRRYFGEGDTEHHHFRATLFKKRWFPGVGCWLGSVARSGESFRRMQTIFSVNLNSVADNSGIAGECFRRGRPIIIVVDPVGTDGDTDAAEIRRRKYRRVTYLADEELNNISVAACVFLAVPISIGNRRWGVLVLDSTDPESGPSDETQLQERLESLRTTAVYLGAMLS